MSIWTNEQLNAINCRDCNVLVSAAAGSGKTSVLVERVIQKITDKYNPVDIDKLLIVTFTNAAAAEMKSRISKRLTEYIKNEINNSNYKHQLSLLPSANICTIDSFCINLVRDNFFKLDIQQDFKILEDAQSVIIEDDAINAVIEEYYDTDNKDFKKVVELLSSTKNEKPFINTIKQINSYIMVQSFPFKWLDNMAESYNPNINIDDSIWFKYIKNNVETNINAILDLINISLSSVGKDDELYSELVSILSSDLDGFKHILAANCWEEYKNAVDNMSFVTFTRKKGEFSVKEAVKSNRDIYKSIFNNEIKPLFSATKEEYIEDCKMLYPSVLTIIDIVKKYNLKMLEIKKELNSYSFADIEQFAINLLFTLDGDRVVKTSLAKDYEDQFDEILIDEYQDTNRAQDTLFKMLSNRKNRFMVGDVKQSIYRFRLAMPQIFTQKKNTYDYFGTPNSVNQKIILDKNFRSRQGICEYVNHIFSTVMTEQVGELDYNSEEYLNNGADFEKSNIPSAQIKIVTVPEDMNSDEYEAHQIAKLINDKVKSKELIKKNGSYYPIEYSDFAILLRSASSRMPIYHKVLTQYGIPVVSNNKVNLFDNNEVAILLSFLRAIENPSLDIPLLATLMSVFYGYTPDDIAYAKVNYKSNNLYGSIIQDDRFKSFIDDIDRYKKYSSSMTVEGFIRQIINDTSYLSIISSMGNADIRKQNVMRFIDLAKRFDQGDNIGLTAFIRYIDSVIKSGASIESSSQSFSNANAVELMTIHKSKGLEFPVCILAGSSHKYNTDEQKGLIQLNFDYGLGLKVYNEEHFYRYNTVQYNCIKEMNSVSSQSENLRVLYVALTRAKEQFITFYSSKEPNKHISKLADKITDKGVLPSIVKHISCDADIILLCALLHKDGKQLRELCEKPISPNTLYDYDLDVSFVDDIEGKEEFDEIKVSASPELINQIKDRLSFRYDRAELSNFSSKRAASSLDNKEKGFKYLASSKPSFLNNTGLTPAQKGTAIHTFMQHCDFNNAMKDLDAEIERLLTKSYITNEQAKVIDNSKLLAFFNSSLAERIISSDKVYREIKVTSFVNASDLENTQFDDKILVQGIADLVFEENGELVLVDYKTDRVDSCDELLDLYKNQISFYKNAIQKTLNKPVKEALLYSFGLNKVCIYK